MLLERLIANPARRLIVVVAGRAADALNPLVAPSTWQGEALKAPPAQLAKDLLAAFRASPIDDKGMKALHGRRVIHHAEATAAMTEDKVRDALGRTVVIERVAKAEVTDRIGRYLRKRGIPDDVPPRRDRSLAWDCGDKAQGRGGCCLGDRAPGRARRPAIDPSAGLYNRFGRNGVGSRRRAPPIACCCPA